MRRTQLHFGDIPAEGGEPHRTVKQTNLRTLCKITCLGSSIGAKSQKSTKDWGDISDWRKLKEHRWLKSMHNFKLDLCTTKALLEYLVMYQQDFPYFDGCIVITQENILVCRGSLTAMSPCFMASWAVLASRLFMPPCLISWPTKPPRRFNRWSMPSQENPCITNGGSVATQPALSMASSSVATCQFYVACWAPIPSPKPMAEFSS